MIIEVGGKENFESDLKLSHLDRTIFIFHADTYDDSNCGYDFDDKSITVLAMSLIIALYQTHEITCFVFYRSAWLAVYGRL
jgi:hypothetical protein